MAMKKLLYTLIVITLISSCRSIEKLVEKGQYDEAIVLATKKLAGKKNKKTDHIQALEKAFAKITQMDMDHISALQADKHPYNWENVLYVAEKIERRQNRIAPFLPLISKEGYEAGFSFVNTDKLINTALDGAAEYHYANAQKLILESERRDDYKSAQEAYEALLLVESYRKHFRDTDILLDKSLELGQAHILVHVDNSGAGYFEEEVLLSEINRIRDYSLNSKWKTYHFEEDGSMDYDFLVDISLIDFDISPERELVNSHVDEKKVKDGWEYVKNKRGEIKTDSLGNKLKRDVFKNVKARITEIVREKASYASIQFKVTELYTNQVVKSRNLNFENLFSDVAVRFTGDKRAICDNDLKYIKANPLPFPDDLSMIYDMALKLNEQIYDNLRYINV